MKTAKGWAVLDKDGELLLRSGDMPLYWRKSVAKNSVTGWAGTKVVRVEIRELKPKKRGR